MVNTLMSGGKGKSRCQDQKFEIYPVRNREPLKVPCISYMLQGNVSVRIGFVTNTPPHFSVVSNDKVYFLLTIYVVCQSAESLPNPGFTLGCRNEETDSV